MPSNVQFEEDPLYSRQAAMRRQTAQHTEQTPRLVRLVLKTGVVKTPVQANYVLIGISALALLLAAYLTLNGFSFGGGTGTNQPPEDVYTPEALELLNRNAR